MKRKRIQQRSKNNKIGQSWTEKFNNLDEKFLCELKRKLEMIEEIINECENWLIEFVQNKEHWKKWKKNEWSCSDLWDSVKPFNNWTLWRKVEGDRGRKIKKMANISQVFGERTLAYKFKRPANPKTDKYKRNHERILNFAKRLFPCVICFSQKWRKNSIIILVDVK